MYTRVMMRSSISPHSRRMASTGATYTAITYHPMGSWPANHDSGAMPRTTSPIMARRKPILARRPRCGRVDVFIYGCSLVERKMDGKPMARAGARPPIWGWHGNPSPRHQRLQWTYEAVFSSFIAPAHLHRRRSGGRREGFLFTATGREGHLSGDGRRSVL